MTSSMRPYFFASSPLMKKITIGVSLDSVLGLTGVAHQDFIEGFPHSQDLTGVDVDIRRLALDPRERLVNHDPSVGEGISFPFGSRAEQQRTHTGRLPDTYRRDSGSNVLQGVIYRKAGGHNAPPGS